MRAPLVKAEQHGSIRIQDLTKVVMARRRLGLAKERLVPFEAARNVSYADDRPCAFHRISAVGLTTQHFENWCAHQPRAYNKVRGWLHRFVG